MNGAAEIVRDVVTHFFSWKCVRTIVIGKKSADSASGADHRAANELGVGQLHERVRDSGGATRIEE